MAYRIEVGFKVKDARALTFIKRVSSFGFKIEDARLFDVYTIDKELPEKELKVTAEMLANPVYEDFKINKANDIKGFDWAIEIGYLPGVTDNIASTLKEEIEDLLNEKFAGGEGIYTSRLYFIKGKLKREQVENIALTSYNPLIQRAEIKDSKQYIKEKGMEIIIPKVRLSSDIKADEVDLEVSDEELMAIGKSGVQNADGTRRGPLALDLVSMKVIREYFNKKWRKPTDLELESIAQTWSEHCKHTIFAASFDEIKKGLYKEYIQKSTNEIRKRKGKDDFCVSVFTDNSGAIIFDNEYLVTDKVETHNSPSALDPFGGAITGIVGVNRDAIGFGMGAKPIVNRYGYCFADPRDERPLYKTADKSQKMLIPRKIMEGVIQGVNVGGNCSGIPTPQGFAYFDERYRGKPLVFVGTIGLIPRKVNGKNSCDKCANAGDYIVVIGGRVGADGIHGATFSSEALSSGSPATAVQIGDPITQKKLSDAVVKEARDMGLYNSITDNGAGGISCSVAEMAKESGGFDLDLDKVPLKYPGLTPWEIWVSESQERMTLSVPKQKWPKFKDLMDRRGVEATIIGTFTGDGQAIVRFKGQEVMNVDMEFLHEGLPKKFITSKYTKEKYEEPKNPCPINLTSVLEKMLKRLNIASFEFISNQYDHEVQGGSVIKPLQGKGRVNGYASVVKPRLDSKRGIVVSQGLYPSYSDIDTYHMAASSIDTAIRNAVSVGGNPKKMALLDNFCWCSSNEEERLGQLKAAVKACYDYSLGYEIPFISGKDSMFNDFKGFNEKGQEVKISVPPTLLVSSLGVIDDISYTIDCAVKEPGDLVYLVGETKEELGGSEYFKELGFVGNLVPQVDFKKAKKIYENFYQAVQKRLIASAISVVSGGLGVALAKTAIAGGFGIEADLSKIKTGVKRDDWLLFSESQSRILATVSPKNKEKFEKEMAGVPFYLIGKVRNDDQFVIKGLKGKEIINSKINNLEKAYKETLKNY
ncbi:MAG: AIR synthase-related protein [Patescibacteria group bacterium]|nr:AIR synthase-related protein [Patescibacteria group bacterium]MCL5094198.1 AIR synthase-related protein [Patescibacteria group bacterium]